MRLRLTTALAAVCGALFALAFASAARADDSQIKISEVYTDATAGTGDFVELQLAAPGQQITAGHTLRTYLPNGNPIVSADFPAATIQSTNNATVLIGWGGNPTADFTVGASFNIPPVGGAVCLLASAFNVLPGTPIDCVSWGTFAGNSNAQYPSSAAGTAGPGPLGAALSLNRSKAANCATLLDPADDTNNSAADFFLSAPTPRNNGVFPTESACPLPVKAKKCKKKKHHNRSAQVAKKKKCKKHKKHKH
jgi:hypothetical protein